MEWYTTPDGKYRIESLSAATIPGALLLIRDHFFVDAPMSVSLGVHESPKGREELLELLADTALDGVSLVAVHVETGEVVATVFNKLQVKNKASSEKTFFEIFREERCTDPVAQRLLDFIVDFDKLDFFEIYKTDCILELTFLGTHREHRKNNLATLLCEYTYELGKRLKDGRIPEIKITVEDLGPKYKHLKDRKSVEIPPKATVMTCTAPGSQAIGRKLKYTLLKNVSFKDFIFEGRSFIEKIGKYTDHGELIGKAIE